MAHVALPAVFVLYAGYRYGWGERAVGFTLALVGACAVVVQGGLVGRFVKRFGERRTLVIRRVSASEQGQLQGANSSIQGIANLVAPVIFALLFAYAIGADRGWNLPG